MENRRGRVRDRESIGAWTTLITFAGLSGEGDLGRTKQVVERRVGDKRPVEAFTCPGCKDLGQARVMNDGVSVVAVFVVGTATRVPCLAFLPPVLFQSGAMMLAMMCVMADMVHRSRTLLVQAIRRQNSGSPLHRQKQHEKGDHEIAHGTDCRGQQTCRHFADARAMGRNGKTWDGRHNWSSVMQRRTPGRPILCPTTATSLSIAEIELVHARALFRRHVNQFFDDLLTRFARPSVPGRNR